MFLSQGSDKENCFALFSKVFVKGYLPNVKVDAFRAVRF